MATKYTKSPNRETPNERSSVEVRDTIVHLLWSYIFYQKYTGSVDDVLYENSITYSGRESGF